MWLEQPNKAGYWLFVGIRKTRSKGYDTKIAAPCQVRDDTKYPKSAVYYAGSGFAYTIAQHEGRWFFLGDLLDEGRKKFPIFI